ncbi:MAG: DJ-1/PfpI family protein [Candidatus Aenigmarchaeota archaeon]|nr:DJ-1/PfpI family protein [Candidatus Aenigmarchaeota archaeon]
MKILLPLAEGFEEIEAFAVVDILRRAGIKVDLVGVVGTVIKSARGVSVMADKRLAEINPEEYDGIVLPGGNPGYINLGKTQKILEIIKNFNEKGKLIAAICASPSILAKAGVLDDKVATIYPGMEKELPHPREGRVIVDKNVITSQAPGTAIEFALKIVEVLVGKDKALQLKRDLVV